MSRVMFGASVHSVDEMSPRSIVLDPTLSTSTSTPIVSAARGRSRPSQTGSSAWPPSNIKVADGETASSSFLQYLRETIHPYVGSTSFTEGSTHDRLLDIDQPEPRPELIANLSYDCSALFEHYLEATSGLLDLFTADEIDTIITQLRSSTQPMPFISNNDEDAAGLHIALAIGAQVHGAAAELKDVSATYFCRGRQVAFDSMLGSQSLGMIRLFTLLAVYMIGACQRDTACMYLGVAAKAATVLGLHRPDSYHSLARDDAAARTRIWNSLRNVDILSSFIFGRPKSIPTVRQTFGLTHVSVDSAGQVQSAFTAIAAGCSLLEEIVERLSYGKILHVPTAETLLANLRGWTSSLPPVLRRITFSNVSAASPAARFAVSPPELEGQTTIRTPRSDDRQTLTGSLHVSCVYYFCVILITRPFLIAYLLSRLRGRAPDQLISDPAEASDMAIKNSTVSKMAQVCVSAAIHTADTCASAKANGFPFGNLCLLKAWVFGAGLVLGFSKFAGEPRRDIDRSFDHVCDILNDIAATSPQARLYGDILESLREAVAKWHNRVTCEVKRTVQEYMDNILEIEGSSTLASASRSQNSNIAAGHRRAFESQDPTNAGELNDPWAGSTPLSSSEVLHHLGFGDMSSEYGYDLMFNFEPFEKLFYSVE